MIFTFGNYKLDIDVERTREFYKIERHLAEGCSCDGCQNFAKACESFPQNVLDFFEKMGIEPKKAAEVYINCAENNGKTVFYGGFYHICGTVLDGESAWEPMSENVNRWETNRCFEVAPNFFVSFEQGGSLIADGFPKPIVSMNIEFHVPWVLDKPNDYL